jgi:hypothetical protein
VGLQRPKEESRILNGDIIGQSRGYGKPCTCISVPPQSAAEPLQDINSEVQEPPEVPLMDGWTVPEGNQPKLIFTGVVGIDPRVAAMLADGTPHGFFSSVIDDFTLNGMVGETNVCATQKLLDESDATPHRVHSWQSPTKER